MYNYYVHYKTQLYSDRLPPQAERWQGEGEEANIYNMFSIVSEPPKLPKCFLVLFEDDEFLGSQKSELLSAPLTIHSGMFSSSTDVLQLLYETWCSSRAGGWRRQGLVIPWDLKRDWYFLQKVDMITADSGPAWCWKLPVGVCTLYTRDGRSVAIPLLTIFMENLWTLQEMGGRDWGFTYHTYKKSQCWGNLPDPLARDTRVAGSNQSWAVSKVGLPNFRK